MSFYPWNSPDSSEGSVVEGRMSDQITRRYGMTGYSEPARLRGALAELLAGGAKLYDVSNAKYGGLGDGATDNATAIAAAIVDLENASTKGGVLFFPDGAWYTSTAVAISPTTSKTILIAGESKRGTYLYPMTSGQTVIRLGSDTPDASGTTTKNISYCGIENISVSGSLLASGNNIGVQITQGQRCWMRNVIIEALPTSSIGLYLLGSTTTGIGAAAAPHLWRCNFQLVDVATTRRPLVMENADENDFFGCNFGCLTGITAAADSVRAVDLIQGHNNHFFGLLLSGDTNLTYRASYAGMYLRDPTKGDVSGIFVYGGVGEGFNHSGPYIASSAVLGVRFMGWNSSVSAYTFYNGSDDGGAERANNVKIETEDLSHLSYVASRQGYTETLTFANADTTPSVKGSNSFAAGNSGGTIISNFDDGKPGQEISVLLDANTSITHDTSKIRTPGAATITAAAHKLACFENIGGIWETKSVSTNA